MKRQDKGRALVLGRQIFVDLWSLSGFEPFYCENPQDLGRVLPDLLHTGIVLIIVEEEWFHKIPELMRKKLEAKSTPSWVSFPSLNIRLD